MDNGGKLETQIHCEPDLAKFCHFDAHFEKS